ncbi:sulfur oxidation c-type cytochrome SoxA [Beggiatoa leptomitoformis]|uniref:L-cysteine S-thiosulfotransferase subunit SoxA n=1 Tax=Beggiatoa leptomitoformis TaxID=288004 RepID=A0A2N9YGN3_9GAMM|nr:sulfur oxidation c-type cytochrome SoxA [Beggiatoa leptomitoformis]ALG68158.1 sulfur oxidation c-type cytochrome SoxA [Beggiatoa leptomitoformis]AUI69545.1 sulfur oxidation c-type cytochrome SoxA [Beggiatoa leptomitoformis]
MRFFTLILSLFTFITPLLAAEFSPDIPLDITKPSYANPWKRYKDWAKEDWKTFNTLTESTSPAVGGLKKIDKPIEGNADNGKKLVADRSRGGGCYACHVMPGATLPGNVAPDLSTVATWGRTDEHLFNYIDDPRRYNPTTVMPPWGAHQVFTEAEIMDIVSYLKTLKTPSKFADNKENPQTRPVPVEDRDNLDPFENPGMFGTELGTSLFNKVGATGKSCASCHENATKTFQQWAVTMPKYEPRLKKIMGVEEFITRHARATTGEEYLAQSTENLGLAIYLRYLANGQTIQIKAEDANTKAALQRAEQLMKRKIGQLNFSCNDCHDFGANHWIRGQYLSGLTGMIDHFPTYRTSRAEIWDIRKRLQWCGVAIRANELPPDAAVYGDIELYLMQVNNGKVFSVPGIRH